MRIFRQIRDKKILLVSVDAAKSLCTPSSTQEADIQAALWQMYATARNESISAQAMMESVISWGMTAVTALIAGMTFLIQTNNIKIDHNYVQLIGWFFVCFVALIESSEYITQTGRMLRAGYFARQIERKLIKMIGRFPEDMAWEIFLSRKKRRLFPGYYVTGGGTIFLLAGAQFGPFLLYPAGQRLKIPPLWFFYEQQWWELPAVGTIGIVLICLIQFRIYQRRFSTQD